MYGDLIRGVRKAFSMTQAQLAASAGISTNSLQRYEKGERQPTMDTLNALASAVGLSLRDFIYFDPRRKESAAWRLDFEEKLKHIGYSINGDPAEGYQWIEFSDGTLEMTDEQLKKINDAADSYLRVLLYEFRATHGREFKQKNIDAGGKE